MAVRSRLLLVLGLLLPLVGAELGLRYVGLRLPDPAPWPSIETRLKAGQMQQLGAVGGAQVVFMGTSVTEAAVDPAGLDLGIGGAYNAALPFGTPMGLELWAREFVIPSLEPSLVVLGVPAWPPWGIESEDPLRSGLEQVVEFLQPSSPWRSLLQTSELVRRRDQLRSLPERLAHAPADEGLWTDAGHQTAYYQGRARAVEGVANGGIDVRRSTAANLDALDRLLALFLSRGIGVVLLLEPGECPVAVHDCGTAADRHEWVAALSELAVRRGIEIIDGREPQWDPALFSDPAHFNRAGTEAFTAFLQRRLETLQLEADEPTRTASVRRR
jgi:hypothetical protein